MIFQKISTYSKTDLINILLAFIPISYIAGNLVLNLNVVLIILLVFSFYGKSVIKIKFNTADRLIFLIFLYICINGIYNNYFNFDFPESPNKNLILEKSSLYLRYLLFYLSLRFLLINKLINYKLLFLSLGACSVFVSIDIIFQYFVGFDLFGIKADGRRLSGPFGSELIAGSFLQRFWIFSLFSLILFFHIKNKTIFSLSVISLLIVISLGIIFSGNRVPLIMFCMMAFLLFFFQKDFRKILAILLFFVSIFVTYLFFSSNAYKNHYNEFILNTEKIVSYLQFKIQGKEVSVLTRYTKEFENGFLTWEKNKYFGGGIKASYWHCSKIKVDYSVVLGGISCNTHPHNYYLESLTDLGLTGFLLVLFTFLYILKNSFALLIGKNNTQVKTLMVPFLIIFLIEIFPLKTTGSLFTTTNSTFLFFIIAFIISLTDIKKEKKLYDN